MTNARIMVCLSIMDSFDSGRERFSTSDIVEEVEPSHQTVLRALESLEDEGWVVRKEPDERSYEWVPSRKARRAFSAYEDPGDEITQRDIIDF
jgi:Sugar-specific transcriptional regulator TrmB.